jgi:predicted nucleic acid-binding protein
MRVYFDASIVIAALLSPTGGSAQLFRLIKLGIITGITSQTVVEDKPKRIKRSMDEIEQFIDKSELIVREAITEEELGPYQDQVDREDAHLIAGAKLTKCTHLVTLDKKHLLRPDIQVKFLPLRIVSPKEVLEEITSS